MKAKVKKIIIGTWGLSGDLGELKENPLEVLNKAIELGFTEIDTAPSYGQGKIYKILDKIPTRVKKEIKFNTKCGYNKNLTKKTFSVNDIKKSVENSLDIFGKINVLYIHNPREEIKDWEKILNLLSDFKKKKYIKYSGISFAKNFYFNEKIVNNFDIIQDELNLLTANNYNKIIKYKCKIHSRSPYALGLLINKKKIKFQNNDYRSNIFHSNKRVKVISSQIENLKMIDKNLKKTAINFLMSLKKINKIIFGVKSKKHLIDLKRDLNNMNGIDYEKKKKIFLLNKNYFNNEDKRDLLY